MCLKELKQAIKFRLKVIEADRRFQSHLQSIGKIDELFQKSVYEPEISIKLENERIKEEPPESFDFIQTIDNIIENCTILDSSNANQRFVDEDNNFQDEEDEESSNSEINRKRKSKKYICNVCKKDFSCKSNLNRHVERKHQHKKTYKDISDKSLFCEMCKQFFTTRGSLQKHMKVKHNSNERFVCDFCGNFFPIKYYLIRHIQTHHNDEDLKIQIKKIVKPKPPPTDSPIPCDVCGKILRNRGLLKPHMRSHKTYNLEDYFYCDLCPRKFKTRGGCVWHIQQRHILKAKFPCTECSAVYKGKWELKCHIKSKHTNIRDYRCEICGKGFLDKQKLTIHTRIHTGERPHACHICPQTFIHQTDLRRHIWGKTSHYYSCKLIFNEFLNRSYW